MLRSRGTGPRATVKKTPSLHVGRGPVPRHAPCARERVSSAMRLAVRLFKHDNFQLIQRTKDTFREF